MSKTRFIGDLHGYLYEFKLIVANAPNNIDKIIQVGDFGIGFGQSDYWHESLNDYMIENNIYFLRGNHDNPMQCREMQNNLMSGQHKDFFVVPGAWSIDHAYRTMGVDIWEDEELSYEELEKMISIYDLVRPKVMVTHDCPLSVSKQLFIDANKSFSKQQYKTRTGMALERMFEIHRPEIWVFGHWHCDTDEVINGTRFICLDELSYVDVDMETLDVRWPDYQTKRFEM